MVVLKGGGGGGSSSFKGGRERKGEECDCGSVETKDPLSGFEVMVGGWMRDG